LEQTVTADARIDYQLLVDGSARLDPSNPQRIMSGFGLRSVMTMPAYRQPAILSEQFEYARGTLHEHALESQVLGQTRTFFVYEPAGQLIGAQYPSLYIHDGSDALTLIDMPDVLDRLIGRREIPPLVAVFIPPITRQVEYNGNADFMEFVAREIVPFVQANYAVDLAAAQTGVWGASLGGLLAVELGGTYGDVFGRIFAQSAAFSMSARSVEALAAGLSAEQKLYLNIGIYETAVLPEQPMGDFLAANRAMRDVLLERDVPFDYSESPQGHSWGLWQDRLPDGLPYLFRE
jgi:enterochelin esterase family protein